jgi:hypothetical protein
MKILLEVFAVIAVLDFVVIAGLFVGHAYHKRKYQRSKSAQPDLDQILTEMLAEAEPELSGEPDTGFSTYLLSIENNEAFVIRLDGEANVTGQTSLGDAETTEQADALAGAAGWRAADDWSFEGGEPMVGLVPKPITAAFVATSEIKPDEAVALAQKVGLVEVLSVLKQEVLADEGKVRVYFSASKPRGWVDSEIAFGWE